MQILVANFAHSIGWLNVRQSALRKFVRIRFIWTPNENSVLTLETPEKREPESSGPLFRTGERNLEGCVRETEISLQTESAAVRAGEPRKALETREKLGRNEKRPAVDLSTPGVKSFGRQS